MMLCSGSRRIAVRPMKTATSRHRPLPSNVTRPLSSPNNRQTVVLPKTRQLVSLSRGQQQLQQRRSMSAQTSQLSRPRLTSIRHQRQHVQPRSSTTRRNKATLANDMANDVSNDMAAKSSTGFQSSRADKSFSWEAIENFLRKTRTLPVPRWITPRHYTITLAEVLGHSSFLLVAISYAVDDFLMLRCIAVAGSTAMLFFTYYQ